LIALTQNTSASASPTAPRHLMFAGIQAASLLSQHRCTADHHGDKKPMLTSSTPQ